MHHPQTSSILTPSTTHVYTYTFDTTSQKCPKTSYRKSTLPKSAKTSHVGMHFHQKTLPRKPMKQATVHTGGHAQTTHTSQRNAFTAYSYHPYIFPTTPTKFVPHPHTQLLNQSRTTIHNHAPSATTPCLHSTTSLSTNITYFTKRNTPHYNQPKPSRQHYSQENALYTTNPTFTSTNQSEQFSQHPYCH